METGSLPRDYRLPIDDRCEECRNGWTWFEHGGLVNCFCKTEVKNIDKVLEELEKQIKAK